MKAPVALVFSKDRPLQLDAALRSFARHCLDAGSVEVKVLYKASTSRLSSLYRRLIREHPGVDFVLEGDFRRDVLLLLRGRDFVLLVVDDTMFVRDFAMADTVDTLGKHPEMLGFSLRLARNTTNCYSMKDEQRLPDLEALDGGILKYRWPGADYDFGYPLELSSSLYRVKEMLPLLEQLEFKNPNTLEEVMSQNAVRFRESHPALACYESSVAFSIPANKVQSVCANRAGENVAYSAEALAAAFARGQRIQTEWFDGFVPEGCHQEVELTTTAKAEPVPLVSVVIPCYKQAQYLPEAVASVVAQTFEDWELIIVNDGSPDDTSRVGEALIQQNPGKCIRLLGKENGGLADARNAGISAASGAYILPLDADDRILPTMLKKTVALLDSEPGVAIAYTDVAHFGATEKIVEAAEYDFKKLCGGNQLNYCSLYRWEAWELAGGYNPNMLWGYEDWDLWIGCGESGFQARRIPGAFLEYRVKESSMFTDALAHDAALRARIVLNHPALYDASEQEAARAIWSNPPIAGPPGMPKVSVIVPTYNRPDRLAETLRSISAQTLKGFEIIVINDNGIDVSHVVASCKPDADIVSLRHAKNQGLAAARNTGLRRARGRYIAYLDDDDIFLPDHLETLVGFLESSGEKAAYTDAWCAEEEPADRDYKVVRREVLHSTDWDNDRVLVQNLAPVLCFMHERTIGIAAGEFDERLTTHEDWDYWIRLSRLSTPVHIPKVTCEFRIRKDGSSMTSGRRADFLRTARMIYKKHQTHARGKEAILNAQARFLRGLEAEVSALHKEPSGKGVGALLRRMFRRRAS